jgi:hypothetical protein
MFHDIRTDALLSSCSHPPSRSLSMSIASMPRGPMTMSNGFTTDEPQPRILPSETIVDVLVVGAGPIGLLCAYQLAKFSAGKTRVVLIGDCRLQSSSSMLIRTLTRSGFVTSQTRTINEILRFMDEHVRCYLEPLNSGISSGSWTRY